jgi:ElaB/YqjD/DUF883 family membrane-anchored ribosome-binding protein
MSDITTEKLIADFRVLIDDAEQLIRITAGQAGERVTELREHLTRTIEEGRAALAACEKDLRDRADRAKIRAITFLRDEGWCWLALAGFFGLLASMALCCQKRGHTRPEQRRENPLDRRGDNVTNASG